ncbi:hypothetical protein H1R20_g10037, partial [Candolleomyces eurysporus]
MFSKFASLLALVAVTPLVSALTLNIPENITTQGTTTFTWTYETSDEPFSLYLYNEEFNDSFAIANNVEPSLGSVSIQIPVVPVRDGYTLRAVNVGNIEDVYSSTGSFSVGAATQSIPTTPTATRTTSSGTGTSTRPVTTTTSTTSAATTSTSNTATSTTSNTAPNPLATNLSGASSLKFNSGLVAAALAGVAAVAL